MAIGVFLTDDHAIVREGLRLILEAEGDIKVVGEAADGRKAVHEVRQHCPDVVIIDISMPELNGIEATRQIREACPSTQGVILSVYSTNEHVVRSLEAGARGFILKEAAGQDVVKAVRTVHAGRRYLCPGISEKVVDDYIGRRQKTGARGPLEHLSSREREVLQLVVEGKTSAGIAETLHLSPKTVETYRSRLMQKLEIHDIPSLVKFAIQHGLTPFK
jgi:DNA-binding NarL/FixJ family response regulator